MSIYGVVIDDSSQHSMCKEMQRLQVPAKRLAIAKSLLIYFSLEIDPS